MSNHPSESPENPKSPSFLPAPSSQDASPKPSDSGDRSVVALSEPGLDDPVSQNLVKSNAAGTGRPRKTWRGFVCEMCHTSQADHDRPLHPRRGPNGPGTLCNRCGLKWRRQQASQQAKNADARPSFNSSTPQLMPEQFQFQQALLRSQSLAGKAPLPPGFGSTSSPVMGSPILAYNSAGQPVSFGSQMGLFPGAPPDQMQMMAMMYQQYQLQLYLYQLQQAQQQAGGSGSVGAAAAMPASMAQYTSMLSQAGPQSPLFAAQLGTNSAFSSSQPSSSSTLFSSSASSGRRREGLPPATLPTPAQQAFTLYSAHSQGMPAELGSVPTYRYLTDDDKPLGLHSMNHDAT